MTGSSRHVTNTQRARTADLNVYDAQAVAAPLGAEGFGEQQSSSGLGI
jgi:hypothetical protein